MTRLVRDDLTVTWASRMWRAAAGGSPMSCRASKIVAPRLSLTLAASTADAGFSHFRRATETPFDRVFEARP